MFTKSTSKSLELLQKIMPKRKRTFKNRRRRPYKKRRPARRSYRMSKSSALPLGKKFRFRTRYHEQAVTFTATSASPAVGVFTMNGLYDPNITGVGHQPIGFDQIMPMYDHYHVIASKITVKCTNLDATTGGILTLNLRDSATTSADLNEIVENGNCKSVLIGTSGSSDGTKTLTLKCSPSKFFGRSAMEGTKYQGSQSQNPSDQVYCHINWQGAQNISTVSAVMQTTIEYIAILTEPKQLLKS